MQLIRELLTEAGNEPKWVRDPSKDGYAVYDAKGKLYTVHKWKSQFDANSAYEEALKTVAFLKTFPLGKKDKSPKFTDKDGEVYKLVFSSEEIKSMPGTTVHVVTNHWWKNGQKQVLLFVDSKGHKWSTSIDGPFGTNELKKIYWDEKHKRD